MVQRWNLKFLIVGAMVLTLAGSGAAAPITWNLVGVAFEDGGTASGSFIYDFDTNSVWSWSVITTAGHHSTADGAPLNGATYSSSVVGQTSADVGPGGVTFQITSDQFWELAFGDDMTDAGGRLAILADGWEQDGPIDDGGLHRILTSGKIVSSDGCVPEPDALRLTAAGVFLLCLLRKRPRA